MDDMRIFEGFRLRKMGVRQVGVRLVIRDVGATVRIQSDLLLTQERTSYDMLIEEYRVVLCARQSHSSTGYSLSGA
jgi:hypothetical protein